MSSSHTEPINPATEQVCATCTYYQPTLDWEGLCNCTMSLSCGTFVDCRYRCRHWSFNLKDQPTCLNQAKSTE